MSDLELKLLNLVATKEEREKIIPLFASLDDEDDEEGLDTEDENDDDDVLDSDDDSDVDEGLELDEDGDE